MSVPETTSRAGRFTLPAIVRHERFLLGELDSRILDRVLDLRGLLDRDLALGDRLFDEPVKQPLRFGDVGRDLGLAVGVSAVGLGCDRDRLGADKRLRRRDAAVV